MIGDNIGPLIWSGIKGRVKNHFREYWPIWFAVACGVAGLAVGIWR